MNDEYVESGYYKIDLHELFHGMIRSVRHLLLQGVLLILVGAVTMGVLTHVRYTPKYQASASFTVRVVNPFYSNQQTYNNAAATQIAETFPQILTSGVLSERVKDRLGISYIPSIKAEALGTTNAITLTVTADDPQLAYDVLNCVTEIYPSVAELVVGPTTMTVLSESGIPAAPTTKPNYAKAVILGALVGGVVWAGLAFLYWMTHQTVNSEEELSKIVNIPCMGRLPKVRGFDRKKGKCPILNDSNDKFGFNESVRLLRVRVEKALNKQGCKVLLVSSTIPNEGKTTVSVNLATALAQKGKKTLLVDCDLRNPSIGEIYGMDIQYGVTEFLQGKCSLKDALYKMDDGNLYVIFGGASISNPEKLLTHKNAKRFVEAAKETFDYIILDTPPCALMSDAAEIGALADGILLTVRQDFACRQQIQEGIQLLGDCNKPILGCVLNMTTPQLGRGSYYSYYGYGYGYGYYGSHGSEKGNEEAEA